jgi:hypothetical protein
MLGTDDHMLNGKHIFIATEAMPAKFNIFLEKKMN